MAQRTEKSTRFWAALVLSLLAASVLSAALLFLLREDGSRVEIYRNGALLDPWTRMLPMNTRGKAAAATRW